MCALIAIRSPLVLRVRCLCHDYQKCLGVNTSPVTLLTVCLRGRFEKTPRNRFREGLSDFSLHSSARCWENRSIKDSLPAVFNDFFLPPELFVSPRIGLQALE